MAKEDFCLGLSPRVQEFLGRFGGRLVDLPEIVERIDRKRAGREWPGMVKWIAEEGPGWVNSRQTLVFSIPLACLSGENCLDFTQEVWRLQPALFVYLVFDEDAIVRVDRPGIRRTPGPGSTAS